MMFRGLYVALVTPFSETGEINTPKLEELVEFHVKNGTDGLVVCGTTGESACMTRDELGLVTRTVAKCAAGRLKILGGAGARSTRETIENVHAVREAGVDGALVVTPYYNRPNQEGLYRHFASVAEAAGIPVMLYNVPSRTGVDLLPDTVARLAGIENIVALKEAKADIDRVTELVAKCGKEIDLLSGHDPNLLPFLSVGGRGVVSVAGNIVPSDMQRLIRAFEQGDLETARHQHLRLFDLCEALAMDTNPIPVKGAMNLLGLKVGEVRPPLVSLSTTQRKAMREALIRYGLQPVPESVRDREAR